MANCKCGNDMDLLCPKGKGCGCICWDDIEGARNVSYGAKETNFLTYWICLNYWMCLMSMDVIWQELDRCSLGVPEKKANYELMPITMYISQRMIYPSLRLLP